MADSRSLMKRIVRICQPADDPIPITGEIEVSSGPVQFVFNAVDVEVNLDTITPANNRPLPVDLYDTNGQRGTASNPIVVESEKGGEVTFPDIYFDQGGRQRVAELTSLGEYKNIIDKIPDLKDEQGTGTSVHVVNDNGATGTKMSVAAGEWLIRETRYSHFYNSGKGQAVEFTTQNFAIESNVIKRIGYFSSNTTTPFASDYDGTWIESNGEDSEYYVSSFREGNQVLKLPRSNWDDPLDGTGESGATIDFAAFNIFQIDFLWLGGKSIRFVAVVEGRFILFHTYKHGGSESGLIFRSPHQPVRYEIRSSTGSGSLFDICSQVSAEGSRNTIGIPRDIDLGFSVANANNVGDYYLICAVRVDPSKRNQIVNISGFGAFATSNDAFRITLFKNPTITNQNLFNWLNYSPSSAIQYVLGDTANNPSINTLVASTGEKLKSFGVSQRSGESVLDLEDVLFQLTRDIDGNSDVYAVMAAPLTPNLDISGQIELIEKT